MDTMTPQTVYETYLTDLWHSDSGKRGEIAHEIVSEEFVIHRNGTTTMDSGPSILVDLVEQSYALFDKIRVTLDVGPIVDGDLVAARWTFHGNFRGGGLPAATAEPGTEVAFSGIDIVRVEAGKLTEYWMSSDSEHLMIQLGAMGS